jgi:hypothetical protein
MPLRHSLLLALLFAPGLVRAQDAPEQLLSAKTQLYLRWDGGKAHRAAYLQTALGKMMQGDTGKMVDNLFGLLKDNVTAALTVKGLLEGAPPAKVETIQAEVAEASKILEMLGDHGIIVAAEITGTIPPAGQVTLIVPNCGKGGALFAALRLAAAAQDITVKKEKAEDRDLYSIAYGPTNVGWWMEGKHAVVVATTKSAEAALKVMTAGNGPRLAANPMYKKLSEFKEFETTARAFLDAESLVKLAGGFGKEAKQAIEALGLDGLKGATFLSGYEGEAERGLTEIHYSGERKGLLALMTGKPFKLADVPALPQDTITWNMTAFDAAAVYDASLKALETIAGILPAPEAAQIKQAIQQIDQALGIDVRKDLFGALGDRMLQYSSPAEGVFSLSQTIAIKVKDGTKLLDTVDQAVKGIGGLTNAKMGVKKRKYRGIDMREVRVNEQGFFFLPTYAVVDGWLVMAFFPQPVQGFILRSKGELPGWKPDESVERSLNKLPKEFLSVSVSDPRPSVKQVLSLAPMIGSAVRGFFPETKFDPGLIPNGHEACKHLFPNVTVTSDDGKTTRIMTRASLALPFDVAGLDSYVLGAAGIGFFGLFANK